MTANVIDMVQRASAQTLTQDLVDIYQGYVDRPHAERKRMKQMLAFKAGENLLNVHTLFSLPEARDAETNYPVVALAPMSWRKVKFTQADDRCGFHNTSYSSMSILTDESSFHEIPYRAKPFTEGELRGDHISMFRDRMNLEAAVPPVPRSIAPVFPWTRRKCYVLFDANWKTLPIDPYLLEKVSQDQFRIVGHWDISERERELMAMMGLR